MVFLMRLPAAGGSVHPGLPVPCCAPVMCVQSLLLSQSPKPKSERVFAYSLCAIHLLTALCS